MEAILGMIQHGQPDLPAGIHCANLECKTRSGERSRGHQSCRSLMCGHCCQLAAKTALEAGEARPICKVHSRRVHTGHKPLPRENSEGQANAPGDAGDIDVPHEQLDRRNRLEQALKRSVTLVVWYRNGCEPLRLPYEVSTFPLFRLQDFPEIVADLGLQPSSYVDAYNDITGHWEQHKITTVRSVEQEQRLLYRLRPSLLDGLTECPFLDSEIALQPPPRPNQELKRQSEEAYSPVSKYHRIHTSSVPRVPAGPPTGAFVLTSAGKVNQPWLPPAAENPSASASSSSPVAEIGTNGTPVTVSPVNWGFAATGHGHIPAANRTSSQPRPTDALDTPEKPTKRWPTDFSVHEIVTGFKKMQDIISGDARERQKSAFEKVFGCRYVKSTTGRAKLYWKRSSQEVKDYFMNLPKGDSRARWANLIHLMDGRLVIEVENEADKDEDGDDEEQPDYPPKSDEAVMGSLEPPPADHALHTVASGSSVNHNTSSSSLAGATVLPTA